MFFAMSTARRSRFALSLASFALALIAVPAYGQAPTSGWKMPNLNPFQSKTSGPATGRVSDTSKPLVPPVLNPFKLIPGSGGKTSSSSYAKPQGPTTWQKVTGPPKRLARQTADFLNPFDDATPAPRDERVTGSNTLFNSQANQRASKPGTKEGTSRSWLPGWGGGRAAESKPKTVNEFLAQPQIEP
ncbi:hypothetical protein ETAA8_08080 [Anatilimnocola aggregata]|uniref:Uncharacterized protein n=1 Tax=Anatilimnocola aggregata TaxID=2528021 RepID=A0A517Y677_9BACT|nr:hypothetical protein [Anatilimnocola aggregata]QDU25738.1 hypothetical protein ETAA8_08080 [Anatilimnocola aggregata]